MRVRNEKAKILAKILSVAMITTMMSGYVSDPAKAESNMDNQVTEYQQTTEEVTVAQYEEQTGNITKRFNKQANGSANEATTQEASRETVTNQAATTEKTTSEVTTETITKETTTQEITTQEPTTVDPDAFELVAHRGYSGYAPENSIPAFEMAVASGFTAIELDVRRCKPDANGKATWVISHNDSLKNTMGVDVDISTSTYSDLLKYSYTSGNNIDAYDNLKIATLEQVIELMKKYKAEGKKITWQIELKSVSDANNANYFNSEIVQPLKNAGVEDCVKFISFSKAYLKAIRNIDKKLSTGYLSTILDEDAVNDAIKCGADTVIFNGTKNYTIESAVKMAVAKGLKVGVYTLDTPVIMGVYYMWGARIFTTDTVNPKEVNREMLKGKYNTKAFTCTVEKNSYTYDGTRKLPKVKVTYKNVELIEGINYQLSYTDNKNPGTAKIYVSGMNNCTDEREVKFKIVMPKVTGFDDSVTTTSSVTLKWKPISKITGYIVYRYNYTKKKYEPIRTISNPVITSCKLANITSATKCRYRVVAYLKADGKTYYSEPCTAKTTYTKPSNVKITSAKRYGKNKKIKVKWSNSPRCTGYEVVVANDKKMKKVVKKYTVKGSKKQSVAVKKLSKKKTYYIKVRAYLKVGKKVYYSSYSKVVKNKKVK